MRKLTMGMALVTVSVVLGGCVAAPPTIDGKLGDAAWATAHVIPLEKLEQGGKTDVKTVAHVKVDETHLYLAVECFDDAATLKTLKADVTEHDGSNIWQDDEVELFLDPTNKRDSYYQIIVNYKGVTWDAYHPSPGSADNTWEPKYQVKTSVGAKSWVVELALPLSELVHTKKTASTWAINILRNRSASSELIYSTPTMTSSSHTPSAFGKLEGMPVVEPKK